MNKKKKLKIKVLTFLLNQERVDTRTLANTKEILLTLALHRKGLSGQQIMRSMKTPKSSSVVYNILDDLATKKLLTEEYVPSRGPLGKKRIFSLTTQGMLFSGVMHEKLELIEKSLEEWLSKITLENPVMKLNTLLFQDVKDLLGLKRISEYMSEPLLKAFLSLENPEDIFLVWLQEMSPIKLGLWKKLDAENLRPVIFDKMTKHIQEMPLEDQQFLFLHFKNFLEYKMLKYSKKNELLKSYLQKIQNKPNSIHLYCTGCKSIFSKNFYDFISGSFSICPKCKTSLI